LTIADRALRYVLKMPRSIAGQGGGIAAFKVAAVLVVDFDLADEIALPIFGQWNQDCEPPWKENDLRRKLASARRDCKRPPGRLIQTNGVPSRKEAPTTFHTEPLTLEEAQTFAKARGLPIEALRMTAGAGFLRAGVHSKWGRHLAIGEGDFWQLRRFDSGRFWRSDGPKTLDATPAETIPQFLGAGWLGGTTVNVLLVEGTAGLLEGAASIWHVEPLAGWTVLAAKNCHSSFSKSLPILGAVAGRRVLIAPDAGEPGTAAAIRWGEELEAMNCQVEVLALPDGVDDLGDLLRLPDGVNILNNTLKTKPTSSKP
jgi:hypothetical protein